MSRPQRSSAHRLFVRGALKSVGGLHRGLYRLSGGRVGARVWGLSILLLTTTGRKTGKARTTPLCFLPDGDDLVVIASNGGMDWFPSWWLNLEQSPHATVQIGREHRQVTARKASPDEQARLWTQVTTRAPGYLKYQQRTRRKIPVVILHSDFGDRSAKGRDQMLTTSPRESSARGT